MTEHVKNKHPYYADFYNYVKAARKLIALGADINSRGAAPFQVAEMNDAFNALHLFREIKKTNKRYDKERSKFKVEKMQNLLSDITKY